ncbi:hypothetical protein KKC60_04525, partial [Patescibacteria group bacterium]|nr:hypothetical protein [Patescibacteria group bacterium]
MIEVILAIGLFVVIAAGITILVVGAFVAERQGGELTKAQLYSQEGAEAVRNIRDQGWNKFATMDDGVTHGLDNSSGTWDFSGASNTNGKFTRTVEVDTVTRDGVGDIAAGTDDLETKEVTVTTDWEFTTGRANQQVSTFNLTNWDRGLWTETTDAEFNDGTFTDTQVSSDTVILTGAGGGATDSNDWDFSASGDYTFDGAKIEVTGGQASLASSGGGTSSGATTDASFDTGASWTSGNWDQSGSEYVFNNRYTPLGNPGYWVYTYLRGRNNQEMGGYWEQAFTTTVDDPDVTIDLDFQPWFLNNIRTGDTVHFYAFVESSSGQPSGAGSALWSKEFTASDPTQVWTSGISFTDGGNVATAGTYYLKVGFYMDLANAGGNPLRYSLGGFDNVQLDWSKTIPLTYPSDNPSINPTASWNPDNKVTQWTSFTEIATKN